MPQASGASCVSGGGGGAGPGAAAGWGVSGVGMIYGPERDRTELGGKGHKSRLTPRTLPTPPPPPQVTVRPSLVPCRRRSLLHVPGPASG